MRQVEISLKFQLDKRRMVIDRLVSYIIVKNYSAYYIIDIRNGCAI